jgi:hypothetical protein
MDAQQDAYEWGRSCRHSVGLRVLGVAAVVLVLAVLAVLLADLVQTLRDADWRIDSIPDVTGWPVLRHNLTGWMGTS